MFLAKKSHRGNCIHLYGKDRTSMCGASVLESGRNMYTVEDGYAEERAYLIENGIIRGRFCKNCRRVINGNTFDRNL